LGLYSETLLDKKCLGVSFGVWTIENASVPKIIINDTIFFSSTAISIFVISKPQQLPSGV